MRKLFLLLLSLLVVALPAYAIGEGRFLRAAGRLPARSAVLRQLASLQADRYLTQSYLTRSYAVKLAQSDRAAFFSASHLLPFRRMATVAAPAAELKVKDPLFLARNDLLAWPWFEIIEKDLVFLQQHRADLVRRLEVTRALPEQIDYAALIPPHVRKIFIGEEHNRPAIHQAVEQLILQYQARHPDKKIIVLTEFVADRLLPWQLPGRPVSNRLEMRLRRNDEQFAFLNHFMQRGIDVIGLENVAYVQAHETLITPSESQAQSVYGMQERNAHWRRIISEVAEQYPHAVLFIYAGSMHTHYRTPFSLANPSTQNFVLQLESGRLGGDMPFGFVMQTEPFVQSGSQTVTLLTWAERTQLYRTRSGFDACIIFPESNP